MAKPLSDKEFIEKASRWVRESKARYNKIWETEQNVIKYYKNLTLFKRLKMALTGNLKLE